MHLLDQSWVNIDTGPVCAFLLNCSCLYARAIAFLSKCVWCRVTGPRCRRLGDHLARRDCAHRQGRRTHSESVEATQSSVQVRGRSPQRRVPNRGIHKDVLRECWVLLGGYLYPARATDWLTMHSPRGRHSYARAARPERQPIVKRVTGQWNATMQGRPWSREATTAVSTRRQHDEQQTATFTLSRDPNLHGTVPRTRPCRRRCSCVNNNTQPLYRGTW